MPVRGDMARVQALIGCAVIHHQPKSKKLIMDLWFIFLSVWILIREICEAHMKAEKKKIKVGGLWDVTYKVLNVMKVLNAVFAVF